MPISLDEIIGDSEDEDALGFNLFGGPDKTLSQISIELQEQASRAKEIQASSHISTFSTIPAQPGPSTLSINQFTSQVERQGIPTATSSLMPELEPSPQARSKPRPRPVQRARDEFNPELTGVPSIADRAKTRQRRTTATQSYTYEGDVFEDGDADFELGNDDPPKSKTKPKAKVKDANANKSSSSSKGKSKAIASSDVIELTSDSDDDELALKPTVKMKSKKPDNLTTSSTPTSDQMEPPLERPRPRPRPIAKKQKVVDQQASSNPPQNRLDLPSSDSSSRLPRNPIPSSLPPSDLAFLTPQIDRLEVPQIETLPTDLSSSIPPSHRSEVDELLSGDEHLVHRPGPMRNSKPIPPPTFFAGSSSQSSSNNTDGQRKAAGKSDDIVDLTMIPTQAPDMGSSSAAKQTKAKAKRTKKAKEDADDGDPDFGDGQPAPKRKRVAKKKKTDQAPEDGAGDGEKATTKKAKGKAKAVSSTKKAEEVFKSAEFIDDSEDERLPERPSEAGLSSSRKPEITDMQPPTDNRDESTSSVPPQIGSLQDDVDMMDEPVTQPKTNRKRKTAVIMDDEEDDDDFQNSPSAQETPSKKQKTAKAKAVAGAGKKGKTTQSNATDLVTPAPSSRSKQKQRFVVSEDEDEDAAATTAQPEVLSSSDKERQREPAAPSPPSVEVATPARPPSLGLRRAPRKSTPMTELIKRVNSLPNSPFPVNTNARLPSIKATAYSPYLKSSRSALARIAPLHPNRRTPPPPLPPPPPKKKTKKELEREERWEEELIDSLGGIEVWAAMSDAERKDLRKGKFEMEMGGWD